MASRLRPLLGAPLQPECSLRLAIDMAAALSKVNQRGLIHKDIKPANILVNGASGGVADGVRHRFASAA